MSNNKQKSVPIKAKPPVDTNKPMFTKKFSAVEYTFKTGEGDDSFEVKVTHGDRWVTIDCDVDVRDIPTLIAILQDIYSGANV